MTQLFVQHSKEIYTYTGIVSRDCLKTCAKIMEFRIFNIYNSENCNKKKYVLKLEL